MALRTIIEDNYLQLEDKYLRAEDIYGGLHDNYHRDEDNYPRSKNNPLPNNIYITNRNAHPPSLKSK